MMVVDTSAIIAVLLQEPEASVFGPLLRTRDARMSAANLLECEVTILRRLGPEHVPLVAELFEDSRVTFVAFDATQSSLALQAYERFGKGRHPARLGLLDCAAYALAKSLDVPLLYKGNDFAQTDIVSVVT